MAENTERGQSPKKALPLAMNDFIETLNPIWSENNISEFQRHSKTRFRKDIFIVEIPFTFLEIQVIEKTDEYSFKNLPEHCCPGRFLLYPFLK